MARALGVKCWRLHGGLQNRNTEFDFQRARQARARVRWEHGGLQNRYDPVRSRGARPELFGLTVSDFREHMTPMTTLRTRPKNSLTRESVSGFIAASSGMRYGSDHRQALNPTKLGETMN